MGSKNKRKQTFKEEYSRSWDFIKLSRKGKNHARCTLCSADFSIAASGRYDIIQHIATAKHRSNAERKDSNQSILQCVSSKSNDYDTIRAETLWTLYVVEHNMPFTSSDSFSDIAKVMFPDSKVIKWGKGSLFVYVFKKYRFLLKNTGLWASKYRFVFPEVGMSVLMMKKKKEKKFKSVPLFSCL